MKNRVGLIAGISIVVFLIVLGVVGYFYWMSVAYVDTLHARIAGSLVEVSFPGGGRVVDLPIEVGDTVVKNEEVATVEVGGLEATRGKLTRVLVPVRASMTGVVVEKVPQVGDILSPGQPIVTLVDPQQVWVKANVHETKISQVKVGQPVRIRIRALNRTFPGRVEQIVGVTNSALEGHASGTDISTPGLIEVPVKISIDSSGYVLYLGMSAEVRIQLTPNLR